MTSDRVFYGLAPVAFIVLALLALVLLFTGCQLPQHSTAVEQPLVWDAVPGVVGYELCYGTSSQTQRRGMGLATTCTVLLSSGREYWFLVRCLFPLGQASTSNVVRVNVHAAGLNDFSDLTPQGQSGDAGVNGMRKAARDAHEPDWTGLHKRADGAAGRCNVPPYMTASPARACSSARAGAKISAVPVAFPSEGAGLLCPKGLGNEATPGYEPLMRNPTVCAVNTDGNLSA